MAIPRHGAEQYYGQVYCDSDEVAELESELERVRAERDRLTAELAALKEKYRAMVVELTEAPCGKPRTYADDKEYVGVQIPLSLRIACIQERESWGNTFPSPPSVQPRKEIQP